MIRERDLTTIVNRHLDYHNNYFVNELRMGVGIPDVFVSLQSLKNFVFVDDYHQLRILKLVVDDGVETVDGIFKAICIPKSKISAALRQLGDTGTISIDKNSVVLKRDISFRHAGKSVAIEVKIKDWKMGLLQAQRYMMFSDYSYLALQHRYLKNVDLSMARNMGIGLISIESDGISELLRPAQSPVCNPLFRHIALSMFRRPSVRNTVNRTFLSVC